MMKKIVSLFVIFPCTMALLAQSRTLKIEAGEDIAQAYSANGFYRLPHFTKAYLYRNGGVTSPDTKLNYDLLGGNIQFINIGGDTVNLINSSLFDSIQIGELLFYPEEGYMELVTAGSSLRLVKKTEIKWRAEAVGAYGTTNNSGASDKVNNIVLNNNVYKITHNQRVVIMEKIEWYWMDNKRQFYKASRESLLQLLPSEKQVTVKSFLKENKTRFNKEADLRKLMAII